MLSDDDGRGGAGGPIPPLEGVSFVDDGLSAEGVCPPSDARDARSRMRELLGRVPTGARRDEEAGLLLLGLGSALGTYRPVESRTRGRLRGAEAESLSTSPFPFICDCLLRPFARLPAEGGSSIPSSSDGGGMAQGSIDGAIAGSASASSFSFAARLSRASAADNGTGITSTSSNKHSTCEGRYYQHTSCKLKLRV